MRRCSHCEHVSTNNLTECVKTRSNRISALVSAGGSAGLVSQHALVFIIVLCSSWSQLLAVFRFLCLQLGYAAFRLRHWWVVAVSQLRVAQTHCRLESSLICCRLHRWPLWWPASSWWWRWSYLMWVSHTWGLDLLLSCLLVTFLPLCSFRTTGTSFLKLFCPRMHLATCCPSPPSWWPGWRPGSLTLRYSLRKLTTNEVRAALPEDRNMEKKNTIFKHFALHLQPI